MTKTDTIVTREPSWLTGQILIAMPTLQDPRFTQTVIFICAHTEEGAMGVVLNRPLRRVKFGDLLGQLGIEPNPPQREMRLGTGGPVDDNRGFVLHSADWTGEGSLRVSEQYTLTANQEVLQVVAAGGGPARGLLVLGYAGWDAGQLDEEIRQNAWLSVPADEAIVYDEDCTTKWARALAKLKIDPGMLSGTAGRA
ncbi:MAG TPA: YqgE/AlgH family protein [Acidocella sp.]|jgi:putative transcriptional regulator|uniref:YqgE/AlgH family protein n=1 Tax=Acidocella sp. TaxID=50710 RepID=UPI002BF739E7|nr:YqgE/AlgH family protein [Acidocella sp.]HVE21931.1 YqgE/AlgH family protein [Acidocella sp.]